MKTLKVLIADDNVLFRDMIVHFLTEHKTIRIVGEAGDGEEAVERAGELRPDVVLLDIDMPRQNGLDAARTIKQLFPGMKIIIISSHSESSYKKTAQSIGADAYIQKFSVASELYTALNRLNTRKLSGRVPN